MNTVIEKIDEADEESVSEQTKRDLQSIDEEQLESILTSFQDEETNGKTSQQQVMNID